MKTQLVNINSVKNQNRKRVFKEIIGCDLTTRLELARKTNLSAVTVSSIVEEMVKLGIIEEFKDEKSTVGRKPNLLRFIPENKKIVSIDLTSKNFQFMIKDLALRTESSFSYTYENSKSYLMNLEVFCKSIGRAIDEFEVDFELIGIGVSVPGPYNQLKGTVVNGLVPELKAINLQQLLSEWLPDYPISIDHDVKLAAMAEMLAIPDADTKSIFFLSGGGGGGGASAAGDQVYEGANHFAGDVGQTIIFHDERLNLQQLVSWNALVSRMEERDQRSADDRAYFERFHAGDPSLTQELTQIADWLATALNNVVWLYDPNMIIIGGHYNGFGEKFIAMISEQLQGRLVKMMFDNLTITFSHYDEKSSLVGAANFVREKWIEKV